MYDDAAVDSLLDRTQEGIEEKESWANEYLSSFKVNFFFRGDRNIWDSEYHRYPRVYNYVIIIIKNSIEFYWLALIGVSKIFQPTF